MSRILDIEEVDAALQRAANKAVGGTREERSGRFQPVRSSAVRSVRFDHDARTLDITFVSGKTYRYLDVPLEIYIDFIDAESKGDYFNNNIKDAFAHAMVTSHARR
jgi:hypothetical protein